MKLFVSILLTITFALTVGCITSASSGYKLSQNESTNTNMNGGVIRLDPTKGVYIHVNDSHHSVGIENAYIHKTNGSLVIVKDNKNPVVTTTVLPDETLAEKGITLGLSGGGKVSHIFFYKDGKQLKLHWPSHYKQVASATSNVWFTSVTYGK